jgi:arylformamidase
MPTYDITRTISPSIAVWPGDEPFSYEVISRRVNDSGVNLTRLRIGPHTGTHMDAPWHYENAGEHPADVPFEPYVGPARVATIARQRGGIVPEDFAEHELRDTRRLLIHTWVSDVPDDRWPEDFPHPTVALIDWLAALGVILLGVDMPSVDRFDDPGLPSHLRLRHCGIVNLENLCLKGVPDGKYELIALPLKIKDICGSPVRAILRSE